MQEVNSISIDDLQLVVNIIDVCTKRGAFEGGELLAIGQIREKFAAFVKIHSKKDVDEVETIPAEDTE